MIIVQRFQDVKRKMKKYGFFIFSGQLSVVSCQEIESRKNSIIFNSRKTFNDRTRLFLKCTSLRREGDYSFHKVVYSSIFSCDR